MLTARCAAVGIAVSAGAALVLLRRRRRALALRVRPVVRFGVMGCANIAKKFCVSVRESGSAIVCGVASRDAHKAAMWISENCPGATAYASYYDLLADDTIEAVYIPLPTALRTEWALRAAARGKHVLLEKPVGPNAAEAARIVAACRKYGVIYMDNTMFMHHGRLSAMRAALDEPEFGQPCLVASSFSVPVDESDMAANIRSQRALEPLGAIGDLAWYNVRFTLWAFDYDAPLRVSCHVHATSADGGSLAASAVLVYADGRYATFDCSFRHSLRQWGEVSSASRTLYLDDFVIPQSDTSHFSISEGCVGEKAIHFLKRVLRTTSVEEPLRQHASLVHTFATLVRTGDTNSFWEGQAFWPHVSLLTQTVVDACAASAEKDGAWVDVASVPAA